VVHCFQSNQLRTRFCTDRASHTNHAKQAQAYLADTLTRLVNRAPASQIDHPMPLAYVASKRALAVACVLHAAELPIRSLADLLDRFKTDPGSVSWGCFALGSPDHILCALIVKAAGGDVAKMNYIVAAAGGEMLAQVMGGHLTVATGGLNNMAQQIQTGKLRAIRVSSPERLPGVSTSRWSTGAACWRRRRCIRPT
jgi:tripartite-type tricarboxylate transporter receptor subunit TctC